MPMPPMRGRAPPGGFAMLQDHPMYAYLPASDVARARRF
jgi:hypothetical protein